MDDNQNSTFNVMKNDPELLIKLVDEYVQVHTIKNCTYFGFLHSIDPATISVILAVPQEDSYQTVIIPGYAILDITKKQYDGNIGPPPRKPLQIELEEDVIKRKTKLKAWFELNLLPVTEVDDKLVIGSVSLLSPYSTFDLFTDNHIVALHIKKIMEKMPDDFSI